ncbi:hypothetical protein D3C86_1607700 [compost metagenome]
MVEDLFIAVQPLALDFAFVGVAERVQPGVTQEFHFGQQLEALEHPRAEAALGRLDAWRGFIQQRWRQVEAQAVVTLEGRFDLLEELAVGEQARHFVLVLDGQDFEVIARHRLGERARLAAQGRFRCAELLDSIPITLGQGCILVLGEETGTPGNAFLQALRQLAVAALDLAGLEVALYPWQVDGSAAAPGEGRAVERYCGTVQLDGLQQGVLAHR